MHPFSHFWNLLDQEQLLGKPILSRLSAVTLYLVDLPLSHSAKQVGNYEISIFKVLQMYVQNTNSLAYFGHSVCMWSAHMHTMPLSFLQLGIVVFYCKQHMKAELGIRNKEFSLLVICPEGLFSVFSRQMKWYSPHCVDSCVEGGSELQCGRNPGAHHQLRWVSRAERCAFTEPGEGGPLPFPQ